MKKLAALHMKNIKLIEAMRINITPEEKMRNIENQKISQELFEFSREFIEEFNKTFPPKTHYDLPGTKDGGKYGKYNYYSQKVICSDGDYTHINMLYENTYKDFWGRWNRFKNLKAFL